MFISGQYFQLCLTFVSEVRNLSIEEKHCVFHPLTHKYWIMLKIHATLTRANVIKLSAAVSREFL